MNNSYKEPFLFPLGINTHTTKYSMAKGLMIMLLLVTEKTVEG